MAMSEYYVDPSGGNDTTGDGTVGTPWKTVQHALDSITKNTTDGDRINVKDTADDVLSAQLDFTTIGAYALTYGLLIQGYTSTAGDGGIGGISGGGTTGIITTSRSYMSFKDMHLHNTGSNVILNLNRSALDNCELNNTSSTGNNVTCTEGFIYNCYFHDMDGAALAAGTSTIIGCYFKAGATYEMDECISCTSQGADIQRCIFSVDGATTAIKSDSQPFRAVGNSILSAGGTGTGILGGSNCYASSIADNVIEGFSGTGGKGIQKTGRDFVYYSNNSVYNCATDLVSGDIAILSYGNESLGSSPFAKSGSDTRANRLTYFEPVDVGSVYGGGVGGLDRGAVPQPAGGGAGGGLLRVNMNGNVFG